MIPAPPGGVVGPGIALELASDFIGPLPDGSYYDVVITTIPGEEAVWEERCPWFPGNRIFWLGTESQGNTSTPFQPTLPVGAQVSINVTLQEPTGQVDSGSAPATWQPTLGIGTQIALKPTSSSSPLPDPRIDQILAAVVRRLEDQR